MDNPSVVKILSSYNEIVVNTELSFGAVLFELLGLEFIIFPPNEENPASVADVYLRNNDGLDYPHIMLYDDPVFEDSLIPPGKYRWVCLYEHESTVNSLWSYEEKIRNSIDRLIELLSMGEKEKEKEFQKEFLLYWNSSASTKKHTVFLTQEDKFACLDLFCGEIEDRLVELKDVLSDIDAIKDGERNWKHNLGKEVYYIPIIDNRDIIPPHKSYRWSADTIKSIVCGDQVEHLSRETYEGLCSVYPKMQNLILVFGMYIQHSWVCFAVGVKCKAPNGKSLFDTLCEKIVDVEILRTKREDYLYLCEQIGNDIGLSKKRVLLIGAGSLGSYVAFELVKNGATSIKVYDDDKIENENILRWAYAGIGKGDHKSAIIRCLLNHLHPEINVEAETKRINEDLICAEAPKFDLVIVTIGSSDTQLKFNRALKQSECPTPVIYTWLEAGGKNSHILVVDYKSSGCFECLYTDERGNLINNRAIKNSEEETNYRIIRNGCGGTRAAYGTAALLRTTAALLDVIQLLFKRELNTSTLFDVSPYGITKSDTAFPVEACNCCGNR